MSVTATIWNFVIRQRFSNWILETGYWDDEGVWDDEATWNDNPTGRIRNFNKFKVEQENDFHFVIKPSTYWILRDGYWDNKGIWVNTEVWKIP